MSLTYDQKNWVSNFLKKAIDLIRSKRYEYECRGAEYEKAGLSPTKIPEEPRF